MGVVYTTPIVFIYKDDKSMGRDKKINKNQMLGTWFADAIEIGMLDKCGHLIGSSAELTVRQPHEVARASQHGRTACRPTSP